MAEGRTSTSWAKVFATVLIGTVKYIASYLLGIIACVFFCAIFTRYLDHLGDFNVFAALPSLAVHSLQGLYFFFLFAVTEFPDIVLYAWWAVLILLTPFVCEAVVYFRRKTSFRLWRPLWIGFPVGFLGTLGGIWTALQAIP